MAQVKAGAPANVSRDAAPKPLPVQEFIPGVPGRPHNDLTGHKILTAHGDKLDATIADLKRQGVRPTATKLVEAWNARHPDLPAGYGPINTALKKYTKAQNLAQMQNYLLAGAKKALG